MDKDDNNKQHNTYVTFKPYNKEMRTYFDKHYRDNLYVVLFSIQR